MIRIHFKRAQGMTEYIIIVGLVAILLMVAVGQYRFSVKQAIVGTKGAMETGANGRMIGTSDPVGDADVEEEEKKDKDALTPTGGTLPTSTGGSRTVYTNSEGKLVFDTGTALSGDQVKAYNKANP